MLLYSHDNLCGGELCQRGISKKTNQEISELIKSQDEILRLMESNLAGNENFQVIGSGWLAYKAGELNSKATRSLTFATRVLAFVSGVLALFTILQFLKM